MNCSQFALSLPAGHPCQEWTAFDTLPSRLGCQMLPHTVGSPAQEFLSPGFGLGGTVKPIAYSTSVYSGDSIDWEATEYNGHAGRFGH